VPDELAQIQEAIGRASHDVRRSIASLQQSPRPRQSLQEALGQAVKGFAENSGPPTDLCGRLPEPLYLPPGDLEQVLRVVQ
jgi:signal transduction histidine kinase